MKITAREGQPPLQASDMAAVSKAIADAGSEARSREKLSVIFLEADNGNEISIAVGGNETVLGFIYAHRNPPYWVSKGTAASESPVLTCYTVSEHHTEYPRTWVIPFKDGLAAIHEFFRSADLPKCIPWVQV